MRLGNTSPESPRILHPLAASFSGLIVLAADGHINVASCLGVLGSSIKQARRLLPKTAFFCRFRCRFISVAICSI
jgi:hypothetical protein